MFDFPHRDGNTPCHNERTCIQNRGRYLIRRWSRYTSSEPLAPDIRTNQSRLQSSLNHNRRASRSRPVKGPIWVVQKRPTMISSPPNKQKAIGAGDTPSDEDSRTAMAERHHTTDSGRHSEELDCDEQVQRPSLEEGIHINGYQ